MTENNHKVVTRFAPSPTGFVHIGGVRTALFAWLWARKNNGTFVLRIEDTDKEREVAGSIQHIEESLRWLGLEWDFGPEKPGDFGSCIQSERLPKYREYAEKLIAKGLAYPDPYTSEQVDVFRKQAEADKRAFLYRDHRPETFGVWDGTQPLRFKVPVIKKYEWQDAVRGSMHAGEEALDDFILIKSDGYPTYNFAHIVDDYEMGVTHIFRADEFIASTPRFLSLYDALEIPYPVFATLPPILRDDRTKKLGKRDGAKDFLDYRAEGYLPETLFNFLALIGWNPGTEEEVMSKAKIQELFTLYRIQKAGAAFNEEKLDWMNKEHLKLLSEEVRTAEIKGKLLAYENFRESKRMNDDAFVTKIARIVFDHISKWGDVDTMVSDGELDYYFTEPVLSAEKLVWKDSTPADTKKHLEKVAEVFEGATESDFETPDTVKALIFDYATEQGRGNVLWPLRVALSGRDKSPDPFTLASILGKEEVLLRIEKAVSIL